MLRTWETAHVRANFSQQDLGCALADPRNRIQQGHRLLLGHHVRLDHRADAVDGVIEVVDLAEGLGDQEAVVGGKISLSRLRQLVPLGTQPPARQIGEGIDISRERDVGILQDRLQAVDDPSPVLDQGRAMSRQLPELPLGCGRHEAAAQEAVTQPLGDPFRILQIRLTPRDRFDVRRIDHQKGEQALQEVIDGTPIDAGAFHRHMRTAGHLQPVS
jgi:hypothetical protein